jgi:hypothetical protein
MKRNLTSCIIILFLLLMGGHASLLYAGQVALEISTTTGSTKESITTRFRITNRGTEPASQVSILGQFQNEQRSVFIADRINPDQSAEARTNFRLPGNINGTFPLYITVSYQHANGISASSASLASVAIGPRGEKKLAMKASLGDRPGKGEISALYTGMTIESCGLILSLLWGASSLLLGMFSSITLRSSIFSCTWTIELFASHATITNSRPN